MKKLLIITTICGTIAIAGFWREALIQANLMEKGDWKALCERRGDCMM